MAKQLSDTEARSRVALLCPTFSPSVPYPGANAPWKGSCLGCGAEVSPRYANLSQGRGPCLACAHKRRGEQSRISDADARENVTKWAPAFLPSVPYPGALEPWLGICLDCGNTVQPSTTHFNKVLGIARSAAGCAPFSLDVSLMKWHAQAQPNSIPTSLPRLPIREIMERIGLGRVTSAGK